MFVWFLYLYFILQNGLSKIWFIANTDLTIFEFISSGVKGEVYKIIKFTVTKNPEIINLGFGDKINFNEETGAFSIDDLNITHNGDRDIILATIANATYRFTELNHDKFIFFSGSCKIRTRLYRMVISNNLKELEIIFDIFGIIQNGQTGKYETVSFNSQMTFVGFLIKRKWLWKNQTIK